MAEYTVIKPFTDLQDNKHVYRAGDVFPRPGYKVSEERLKALSTAENKRKVALIKPVGEKKPSKSEIARMPVADLRKLAKENGLGNPDEYTGSELKEWLNENI